MKYICSRFGSHWRYSFITCWQTCLCCIIECSWMPVLYFLRGCIYFSTPIHTVKHPNSAGNFFHISGFFFVSFFYNSSEKNPRAQRYKTGIHKHTYLVKIRKRAPKSIQKETKRQGYPWIKLWVLPAALETLFLKYEHILVFQDRFKNVWFCSEKCLILGLHLIYPTSPSQTSCFRLGKTRNKSKFCIAAP